MGKQDLTIKKCIIITPKNKIVEIKINLRQDIYIRPCFLYEETAVDQQTDGHKASKITWH